MNARAQKQPDPVLRYAHLQLGLARLQAAQKPVPPAMLREIQQIEAWAQRTMTTEQMQQALWQVERVKGELLSEERRQESIRSSQAMQQAQALRQHNADTLARRIGRNAGLDVRNAEEFTRFTKGLPLKRGTPKPTKVDPKLVEQATVNATRHIDLAGKGFTPAQWKEKLDYLWEYVGTAQFKDAAKKIGLRPGSDLKAAMVRYQEQEMIDRLSGDMHKHDPVTNVKPDERDVTRALIAKNIALALAKEGTDKELDEFHRPTLHRAAQEIVEDKYGYEGDGIRKDIAKTMLDLWPEDEAPDTTYEYDDTPDPSEDDDG